MKPATTVAQAPARQESRIFPIVVLIGLIVTVQFLPHRLVALPTPITYSIGALMVLAMVFAGVSAAALWATVERWAIWIGVLIGLGTELVLLQTLTADIIFHRHNATPIMLLATSVAIWSMNVVIFTFAYWQLDRDGPLGRARGFTGRADLSFAMGNETDGVPDDWKPSFPDYLSLGFCTSTAFSPTDTLPLTPRAKMLMLAQSTISLVTIVVVAARAINILT